MYILYMPSATSPVEITYMAVGMTLLMSWSFCVHHAPHRPSDVSVHPVGKAAVSAYFTHRLAGSVGRDHWSEAGLAAVTVQSASCVSAVSSLRNALCGGGRRGVWCRGHTHPADEMHIALALLRRLHHLLLRADDVDTAHGVCVVYSPPHRFVSGSAPPHQSEFEYPSGPSDSCANGLDGS